jgi:hypothetical protein
MRFAANCQISTPVAIAAKPDVDFNGMMFSYTVGLMYPAQAAIATNNMQSLRSPFPSTLTQPATNTGGLH